MLRRECSDDRYVQPRPRPLAAQRDLGPQSKADFSLRFAPLRMTCHPERNEASAFLLCRRRSWLLETKLVLVFFAVFLGVSANLTFAAGAPPARASAGSASAVAAQGNAEQARQPAATADQEEHALSPKPDQIARPFGFPITNSMIVSWIVALGLII